MTGGRSLVRRPRSTAARWRLLGIPHAGAGAAALSSWFAAAPADCEVVLVRLPGRESRLGESPPESAQAAAAAVLDDVRELPELPMVVYGYSMGALVAYELTRLASRNGGPEPVLLAVGGHEAPHLPRRHAAIHDLPEEQFVAALRALGGTPEQVLTMPELFALLAPTLRADLRIVETYRHAHPTPLTVPISTYAGEHDPDLDHGAVGAWAHLTTATYRQRRFPGGHFFFLESGGADLMSSVIADSLRHLPPRGP
ncbi:thioesterase II family protein [uncultured Jatrophihabitans sp.]|uniref:thioesterase II family protein n=1 Tax=uncultured Jatrophihabitans sp. TaxID=1610747 RepID=UPI0035C99119